MPHSQWFVLAIEPFADLCAQQGGIGVEALWWFCGRNEGVCQVVDQSQISDTKMACEIDARVRVF